MRPSIGRPDFGVTEIDLGLFEQRLGLQHVGLRRLLGGGQLIDGGLWHVLVLHQRLGALQLQIRIDFVGLRLGEIGRPADRRLLCRYLARCGTEDRLS